MLTLSGLSKSFGGLQAVSDVAFDVQERQIKALIGPNGAGKTTIFNLLTGVLHPDAGSATFGGHELIGLPPHRVACLGISRTFQTSLLFDQMTVLENVMVGHHLSGRSNMLTAALRIFGASAEEREYREVAMAALERAGLADLAGRPAAELPIGQRRLVEVARALAAEPKLLLMDEPAAGLNMRETDAIAELIQEIRSRGITVLLVEHDMSLVMSISDEILVLDGGRRLAEGLPKEIRTDERVLAAYLGEEADD
ncbi:MAG: ABC transporter ATP-binding protein [candidate division WS1 bacterium]|nr:ABC transporter ATP-binding protein [candidate division WS1 bacterium]